MAIKSEIVILEYIYNFLVHIKIPIPLCKPKIMNLDIKF